MARGHTNWTDAQREAARQNALARWANPVFKENARQMAQIPPLCPSCGNTDITNFYTDPKGRRTNAYCKDCHKENCKTRWHSKSPIEKQSSRVSALYGITPDEYKLMHEKQGGKCAICNEVPKTKRLLHVDHCHKTKKVRGLLCSGCNTGIGNLKESVQSLENAIKYLKEHIL